MEIVAIESYYLFIYILVSIYFMLDIIFGVGVIEVEMDRVFVFENEVYILLVLVEV